MPLQCPSLKGLSTFEISRVESEHAFVSFLETGTLLFRSNFPIQGILYMGRFSLVPFMVWSTFPGVSLRTLVFLPGEEIMLTALRRSWKGKNSSPILTIPSLKLIARTWRMGNGRWFLFWKGFLVGAREGKCGWGMVGCHWNVRDLYGCLRGMDQGMATDKRRTVVWGACGCSAV